MKKLSEIAMDEYIYVGDDETGLMTKEDYLESAYFLNKEDISLYEADKTIAAFSWDDVVECMQDEQYEDWGEDVLFYINEHPELKQAAEIINGIFANHPSYCEGNKIENDMLEERENNGYVP